MRALYDNESSLYPDDVKNGRPWGQDQPQKIEREVNYFPCKRNEFSTTEIELIAIAADAIIGLSLPMAATGIATVL